MKILRENFFLAWLTNPLADAPYAPIKRGGGAVAAGVSRRDLGATPAGLKERRAADSRASLSPAYKGRKKLRPKKVGQERKPPLPMR